MGGKKKLMRLIRGDKRETSRGSGFATNLAGHGTLSLERQAGTLLKMMAPTECSNPISAYAHVHVREQSSEDNSSSDDGFHTDAQHETDSDPGRDSLHSDDNIYENAYCGPVGGGLTTNFIGSEEDFCTTPPALSSTMTAGLSDDESGVMGNHISSDMMTESEYATLPAITLRAAAGRFKPAAENGATNSLQKKKKSQPNVMRVKKPSGNRWSARISTDFFSRNTKTRGSSGRRKGKNGVKKILFLNDFSPSSSTTDPHSPICSDSDSLDSGRCGDTTSLHSSGSSSHMTSADELEPAPIPSTVKSHRRCPSISNISFSTINCHSPCGKSVPVIKVTPQKKLPSVDETPECQLANSSRDSEDGVTNFGRSDNRKDNKVTTVEVEQDISNNNNNNNNNVLGVDCKETEKADCDVSKLPDFMQTRAPIYSVLHYVDHLKKQMSSNTLARAAAINKTPQIKDGISPLSYLLRKLKLDLKMSYDSFVQEFVATPHDGISLLVALLRDIQQFQQSGTTTRRSKLDQYKKSLTDEHDCLLCIKFSLRVEGGIEKLLDIRYGLETVTACLLSSFSKARVTALEILTVSLGVPDGYNRVLDSMTYIRLKFGESVRFKLLVSMLNSQGSVYVLFQLVCMRFLNSLMTCTSGQNARVFLQYELEMAGLDMSQLEKNAQGDGLEYDDLRREIETWKKRFVDVQGLQDELMALQNRCSLLRHEVDSKEDKIKALEDNHADLQTEIDQLRESCNSYMAQNMSLQESVEKMKILCKKKGGKDVKTTEEIPAPPGDSPPVKEGAGTEDKPESPAPSSPSSDTDCSENFIIPAIPPPPPPPPPPEMTKMQTRSLSVHPKVRLPLLNWQPLATAENTVFQAMDEDQLYKELNLTEFENRFRMRPVESPSKQSSPARSDRFQPRPSTTVHLLGSDRMRNIVITKRKIGLTGPEVREYVDQFDVSRLSGDYAELLLRFLPSKDEQKLLSNHAGEFSNLGEAEQFLYHLGHINDCKTKLTVMAFIGAFDEVFKSLNDQITVIQKASVSLLSSWRLRKLFQLILALGNYMNCQRRGVAVGFRLESLSKLGDVKTTDRQHTFLHYLTEVLETQFPTLVDWHEDLDINVPRSASYQSVVTDVKNLKRGLAQIKVEMEKHPEVKPLQVFYDRAVKEMETISESFSRMEEFYEKACSTYGERHILVEPGEFFGFFVKFVKSYKKAYADNHKSSANSSGASSPTHSVIPNGGVPPKQDFLTEAKLLMAQNSHRLATSRTLETGFTEMVKRQKTGLTALPSPIPTLTSGVQAKIQTMSSDPYSLDLQASGNKTNAASKEIVNNWILQNTPSDDFRDSDPEQRFRTSTMKSIPTPERLPLPTAKSSHRHDDVSTLRHGDEEGQAGGSTLRTTDQPKGDPSPDYTNPSSPANTISNASEISRVLREFEGNIHTYLNENVHGVKQPVPARTVDFYRPVTYL